MNIPKFPPQTTIRWPAKIYDINGTLVDPTTVITWVTGPDSSLHQYAPVRDSQGTYHYDLVTSTPAGKWYIQFQGLGAVLVQSAKTPFIIDC